MRLRLSARLDRAPPMPPADPHARAVVAGDALALATLMFHAYHGTVDDEGEGPEGAQAEVDKVLRGGYGPFDFNASELITRDKTVVAATLVTEYQGLPMVAFSMTAPPYQRRGLARAGLLRAMSRLQAAGRERVDLAVTDTNTRARRLYDSLGFKPVPR